MTHNLNNTSIDDRILSLRKELEAVIEAFDPFDENLKNLETPGLPETSRPPEMPKPPETSGPPETPNLTQKMLKRGSKQNNKFYQHTDQQSNSSETPYKRCLIM